MTVLIIRVTSFVIREVIGSNPIEEAVMQLEASIGWMQWVVAPRLEKVRCEFDSHLAAFMVCVAQRQSARLWSERTGFQNSSYTLSG